MREKFFKNEISENISQKHENFFPEKFINFFQFQVFTEHLEHP